MCIRDRGGVDTPLMRQYLEIKQRYPDAILLFRLGDFYEICLLYTSDAADERSSVDLGGRRIIKKKKETKNRTYTAEQKKRNKNHRQQRTK